MAPKKPKIIKNHQKSPKPPNLASLARHEQSCVDSAAPGTSCTAVGAPANAASKLSQN
ncbi:hypothetical protein FIBSPDRAFT_877901 [Athelia psychrophila]|uniref:Uncharacterized protein n=1 Tax=Athelia psychrophila TaxID=1759441 RepID=A0A167VJB4_9AGAM|nr:hypothetical protein FIBSPDRAFT_877901 [Fibularhizoctonia sp. CBS 109695]